MADNSYIYIKQITSTDINNKYFKVIPNPTFPDLPQINPTNIRVFIAGGPALIYGQDYVLIEPNIISFDSRILEKELGLNSPVAFPEYVNLQTFTIVGSNMHHNLCPATEDLPPTDSIYLGKLNGKYKFTYVSGGISIHPTTYQAWHSSDTYCNIDPNDGCYRGRQMIYAPSFGFKPLPGCEEENSNGYPTQEAATLALSGRSAVFEFQNEDVYVFHCDSYIWDNAGSVTFSFEKVIQYPINEDDIIVVLYCDKNSANVSKSKTFILTTQDVLNGYILLDDEPDDLDDIHIEIKGGGFQLFKYDYDGNSSEARKIEFKNLKNELNYDPFIPNVGDIITITYSTKQWTAKRIRENFTIGDVELQNGRVYLKEKVLLGASVHARIIGAPANIREIDFTVDDKSLIWKNYELEKQLFENLPSNTLDYLEVVYHTESAQLPLKSIVEYADNSRSGLTPRLLKKIRPLEYSQKYEVPSENAISESINELNNLNLFIQTGNDINNRIQV